MDMALLRHAGFEAGNRGCPSSKRQSLMLAGPKLKKQQEKCEKALKMEKRYEQGN